MKIKFIISIIIVALSISGCKKGENHPNQAPETRIFLDTISTPDRLTSVVTLYWSGEDRDGFIKEYEISFDKNTWISVQTRMDTTLRFEISGSTTADIQFYVRAIDNENTPDQTPAHLLIPIKNTVPQIHFDATKPIPDTVFSVFSALWTASDPDGEDNLDSSYLKINNGEWLSLPKSVDFVTIVPSQPSISGIQTAKIYKGTNALLHTHLLEKINIGGTNRLYIKTKDKSGMFSDMDSTALFYISTKTSDLLLIDEHAGTSNPKPEAVYFTSLANLNIAFDYFDLNANPLPFPNPALGLYMELYDKVFWISDGTEYPQYGEQIYMEIAANTFQNYLNKGGKLLITTKFPNRFNSPPYANSSPVFSFSPIESFSTAPGQARIPTDSTVFPVGTFSGEYPTLKPSVFMSLISPFNAKNANDNLFHAQIQPSGGWIGPRSVCGTTRFTNGKINQVFFSLELHKLNGNLAAFETVLNQIIKEEFNW